MIKLDRSIVAGVADDRALAVSLVEFAHGCGCSVVAEGVETVDDAQVLREAGVDYGQGWYFGRPGPADQLVDHYAVGPAHADIPSRTPAPR